MSKRIIRLPGVEARSGFKRSSIYAGVKNGTFPPPIPLGARAVGWVESEIDAWIEARIADAKSHASIHVDKAPSEIGVSPKKLQSLIDSGDLPTYKLGRHTLIKRSALAAFQRKLTAGKGGGR